MEYFVFTITPYRLCDRSEKPYKRSAHIFIVDFVDIVCNFSINLMMFERGLKK